MPRVEAALALPVEWFVVPGDLDSDEAIVEWCTQTAYDAWRLRADAGVPEEAVLPGAGERLVVELAGLVASVREQLDVDGGDHAAVWLPAPEFGVVSAVVLVQPGPRTGEREISRYADVLLDGTESAATGHAPAFAQRLESDIPAGPVRGVHSMLGVLEESTRTVALEERTSYGVFPRDHEEIMIEVLFIAARTAAFEDMPAETLELLSTLQVRVGDAA